MHFLKTLLPFWVILLHIPSVLSAQNDLVDPFTGDFKYQVPVLSVPSDKGPSIPIVLKYHGGVTVDQKASWVGLGWDLDMGEIRRDVNGVPDDWNGVVQTTNKYTKTSGTWGNAVPETTKFYGPLYFKNFGTYTGAADDQKQMDVYASASSGTSFIYPDYDNFMVSAPGVEGIFQPLLLDIASLVVKDLPGTESTFICDKNGKRRGLLNVSGTPNYSGASSPTDNSNPGNLNYDCRLFTKDATFRYLDEFGQINVASEADNTYSGQVTSSNMAINSRHIKYYTGFAYDNPTEGLIKYPNLSLSSKGDDIVAFKITNTGGVTYHFSLPVYVNQEKNYSFNMPDFNIANASEAIISTKSRPYVVAWKLTAITGPDFVDNSPYNQVGSEDNGYWVKFSYTLWKDNFDTQAPFYDCSRILGAGQEARQMQEELYPNKAVSDYGEFEDIGNIAKGKVEVYYLDKIETSSHTAFFVKDIRLDEYSKKLYASGTSTPSLKLDRVILFNNADAQRLQNATGVLANPNTSKFSFATPSTLIHIGKYIGDSVEINRRTLSAVVLGYDHSLAKSYWQNIASSYASPNTPVQTNLTFNVAGDNLVYETFSNSLPAGAAGTGKLTLLSITPFGKWAAPNLVPSYVFQYPDNPDYHPLKKDFWGYYKSDWAINKNERYQTSVSKDNVDAWSLQKVSTPMGGVVQINYGSDEYESVGGGAGKPIRVFGGKYDDVAKTFTFDDRGLYDLFQSSIADIGTVAVGYPALCSWGVNIYYKAAGSTFNFLTSQSNTLEKEMFTGPFTYNSTNGVVSNSSGNKFSIGLIFSNGADRTKVAGQSGLSYGLLVNDVYCGKGPDNSIGSVGSRKFNKSIAAVELTKAYGGGLRVNDISVSDIGDNGALVTYKTKYNYSNGAVPNEPSIFTPPFYTRRSKLSEVYDRHNFIPSVGYSKVTIEAIGADNNSGDSYEEYNFYNYTSYPFYKRDVSTMVTDKSVLDPVTNWDNYLDCRAVGGNCSLPGETVFRVEAINRTGVISATDMSALYVGKPKTVKLYDKKGQQIDGSINRLLYQTENEFETKVSTKSSYHMRTHAVIPLTYDMNFLSVAGNAFENNVALGSFGPFNSFSAQPHATVLNSTVFYDKQKHNQVLKKQAISKNDLRSTLEYLEFDELTGVPTRILSKDPGTGESIETIVDLAYKNTSYNDFGPKSETNTKLNLLREVYQTSIYKSGVLTGGVRNSFRNTYPVRQFNGTLYTTGNLTKSYKPFETFSYYPGGEWRKESEYTLFNTNGVALETKDVVGGAYNSIKLGYSDRFTISECTNAKYTEFASSGAEDLIGTTNYFSGEVLCNSSAASICTTATYVHTGMQSLQIGASGKGFEYKIGAADLDPNRAYMARVWMYNNGNTNARLYFELKNNSSGAVINSGFINFAAANTITTSGYVHHRKGWTLLTLNNILIDQALSNPSNFTLIVRCENNGTATTYFDDFRFHPVNSALTSYVYDTFTGQATHVINNNGFYDRIQYDALGRVFRVFNETLEGEKQVSEINRNYYRFSAASPF